MQAQQQAIEGLNASLDAVHAANDQRRRSSDSEAVGEGFDSLKEEPEQADRSRAHAGSRADGHGQQSRTPARLGFNRSEADIDLLTEPG